MPMSPIHQSCTCILDFLFPKTFVDKHFNRVVTPLSRYAGKNKNTSPTAANGHYVNPWHACRNLV
jgi:hypothetical protein